MASATTAATVIGLSDLGFLAGYYGYLKMIDETVSAKRPPRSDKPFPCSFRMETDRDREFVSNVRGARSTLVPDHREEHMNPFGKHASKASNDLHGAKLAPVFSRASQ
jgi:hypothetical protein